MKTKPTFFAQLINLFFITILTCLIFFSLFRHYFDVYLSLILAMISSATISLLFYKFKNRKYIKLGIQSKELAHAEKVMLALYSSPQIVVDKFFYLVIKKSYPEAELKNNWIITKKQAISCFFSNKITSIKEIKERIHICPDFKKEKIAIGLDFEDEASSCNIKLISSVECYAFLKRQKTFPKTENVKIKSRKTLKAAISRKNFKKYILLAVVFSLSSYFMPQIKLYFIFTIITTFLAILSLFSKKETANTFI